jgi:hypothetical protein
VRRKIPDSAKWTQEQSDRLRPYFQAAVGMCALIALLNAAALVLYVHGWVTGGGR